MSQPPITIMQYESRFPKVQGLGSGNFGSVSLRRNAVTGNLIAAKRICEDGAPQAPVEAAAMAALQGSKHVVHPAGPHELHIIHDFPLQGEVTLHLEFCDLFSLRIANGGAQFTRGKLPLALLWKMCRDLTVGLSFMHRAGWLHNDIKADNILLSEAPDFPFVDFKFGDLGHAEAFATANAQFPTSGTALYQWDIKKLGELFQRQLPDLDATEENGLVQLKRIIAGMRGGEASILDVEKQLVPIATTYVQALSEDQTELANVHAVLDTLKAFRPN